MADEAAGAPPGVSVEESLTEIRIAERRQRVAGFLVKRLTAKEIAGQLNVSPRTIESDVAAIRKQMAAQLVGQSTPLDVAAEVMQRSGARERELWLHYTWATHGRKDAAGQVITKPNPSLALALLRELRANTTEETKALQSLGVVYRAPERVQIDARVFAQLEAADPALLDQLARAEDPDAFAAALVGALGEQGAREALGLLTPGTILTAGDRMPGIADALRTSTRATEIEDDLDGLDDIPDAVIEEMP